MKVALIVPGGVDRSGQGRVIPVLLWTIERLAAVAEVHIFALHQEPAPGHWPLLGAEVHNAGKRPVLPRTLAAMLAEHRKGRFDVVHAFWASGPGAIGAAFGALTGVPLVLSLPGGDLCADADIGYGGLLTLLGRLRIRFALASAHSILVPSGPMQAQAAALGVRADLVRFGVALDRWPPGAPRRRHAGSPLRLVHVADLNRVKDEPTLLKALAILRSLGVAFRLDQLGEDTLGGAIQRQVRELGLADVVTFHGHRGRSEVRRMIEGADLLVVSSRHESVPIAAIEAAVAGVPTVGTAVGQLGDWAGRAALAVSVGDAEGLADAIQTLGRDEDLRLRLARAAQADAIRHDADSFVAELRSIYQRVAASAAGERNPPRMELTGR